MRRRSINRVYEDRSHEWKCETNRHVERTRWDVERYTENVTLRNTGAIDDFDNLLQSKFEPLERGTVEIEPLTVADRGGQIILWYLPGILTTMRQVWD